jgi:hypothetical protein
MLIGPPEVKKKTTFDMVVGKYSRSKKIERCMFYQNCCCCCCCSSSIEAAKLFSSSPIVFVIYYLAFSARHLGSELMIFSSADRQTRITLQQQHKME